MRFDLKHDGHFSTLIVCAFTNYTLEGHARKGRLLYFIEQVCSNVTFVTYSRNIQVPEQFDKLSGRQDAFFVWIDVEQSYIHLLFEIMVASKRTWSPIFKKANGIFPALLMEHHSQVLGILFLEERNSSAEWHCLLINQLIASTKLIEPALLIPFSTDVGPI